MRPCVRPSAPSGGRAVLEGLGRLAARARARLQARALGGPCPCICRAARRPGLAARVTRARLTQPPLILPAPAARQGDEDTRRAMMKSFQESNGTVLSTNWQEVGSKKTEWQPPEGTDVKKWEQ